MKKIGFIYIFCSFIFLSYGQIEKVVPPPPQPPKLVNDYTHTLTAEEVRSLENILVAYDDSTSNQVAIVMLETIGDYPIEDVAINILRTWGVGSKEHNNGIVLLVVKQSHQIRFEVGSGLEGAIPDMVAASIIDNEISPNFKIGGFYKGFLDGISAIIQATKGEYKVNPTDKKKSPIAIIIFLLALLLISALISRGGKRQGTFSNRGFNAFPGWYPRMGGGGGSSGGGFGGFGGGFGGGGGASGGW